MKTQYIISAIIFTILMFLINSFITPLIFSREITGESVARSAIISVVIGVIYYFVVVWINKRKKKKE